MRHLPLKYFIYIFELFFFLAYIGTDTTLIIAIMFFHFHAVFFSTIHKLGDMIWKLEIFKEEHTHYLHSSSCIYHPRYFWFKRSFTRKVGGDKQQKAVSLFVVKRKIGPLPTIILVESKKFEI